MSKSIKGNLFFEDLNDSSIVWMQASNNTNKTRVDKSKLNEIKKHTWSQDKNGYFRTNIRQADGTQKSVGLHTFVLGLTDGRVGDHIDNDPSKNLLTDLRPATQAQNALNKKVSKNNKLGVRGCQYDKRSKHYRANIWLHMPEGRFIGKSKDLVALKLAYNAIKCIYIKEEDKEFLALDQIDPKDITIASMAEALNIVRQYVANQSKNSPGRDLPELSIILKQLAN
jgi:hypothetical protein